MLLIAGEALLSLVRRDGRYRLGEAVVNIGHGVVYQVWDGFTKGLVLVPFFAVASLVTWPVLPLDSIWGWVVGLLIYDFLAYWAHRHHHERWLKRTMGHPAGGESIDLVSFPHATNEKTVGNLAQKHLLGVSVEAHGSPSLIPRI